MRAPENAPVPAEQFGRTLSVDEVLYEAERPIVFLTHSAQDERLLAYVADESGHDVWTLLAPISLTRVNELKSGQLTVREALTCSWLWLHREGVAESVAWRVEAGDIEQPFLPAVGTPLLPEHESAIVTRAIGDDVALGRIPASVVAFVTDATRKSVKVLLDFIADAPAEGRPTEEHRSLYDLRVQRFAFASFEVSFSAPPDRLVDRPDLRRLADRFQRALDWAAQVTVEQRPLVAASDEEREAMLQAALLLTPPTGGAIREVQVSGAWMPRGRVRLTLESRERVRAELRLLDVERIATYSGRVGEIDVDKMSFTLRDTEDARDRRGYFSDDLLDDMVQFMREGRRVGVAGLERGGRLYVAAVAPDEVQDRDPPV